MHKTVYKFSRRTFFSQRHTIRIERNRNREYVYIEDLLALARLAGHLKHNLGQPANGYQIFIRGQTGDHKGMVPSIFRTLQDTSNDLVNRVSGYVELIEELRRLHGLKRFRGEIGGAILQHYGIRTPWVDLVDNLFVALWFAVRKRSEQEPIEYLNADAKDFGWLYFIRVESPVNAGRLEGEKGIVSGKRTMWCDLRCYQTSLSLRAHTQHGIFACRRGWSVSQHDLSEFIVATVKFPIAKVLPIHDGGLFSTNYMFPSTYDDNTYKKLITKKVSELIRSVERNNGLQPGELGKIDKYITR